MWWFELVVMIANERGALHSNSIIGEYSVDSVVAEKSHSQQVALCLHDYSLNDALIALSQHCEPQHTAR